MESTFNALKTMETCPVYHPCKCLTDIEEIVQGRLMRVNPGKFMEKPKLVSVLFISHYSFEAFC